MIFTTAKTLFRQSKSADWDRSWLGISKNNALRLYYVFINYIGRLRTGESGLPDVGTIELNGNNVVDMGGLNYLYDESKNSYWLDDIEDADWVVDIGACFGDFLLMARTHGDLQMVAVEPVWSDVCHINFKLNNLNKVTIVNAAISSDPGLAKLEFMGKVSLCYKVRAESILSELSGRIFLKCDCEGGEWSMTPNDFDGVYRAEMEFHQVPGVPINWDLIAFLEEHYYIKSMETGVGKNCVAITAHLYRKIDYWSMKGCPPTTPLTDFFSLV
jgi:FkbM family methyltransferase